MIEGFICALLRICLDKRVDKLLHIRNFAVKFQGFLEHGFDDALDWS